MDQLELRGLPDPLRSINAASSVEVGAERLAMRAGARTDWFIDPAGDVVVDNAPALVMRATGDWMLRSRVSAQHDPTVDAAVLVVHAEPATWAKLCLERSPQGEIMVVSVVTRGVSDDCNSVTVEGDSVWLRIARIGRAFAFHYSLDGATWRMVRYFTLGSPGSVEVGFLAQSPTGPGCTATFADIAFVAERLTDVRSGV